MRNYYVITRVEHNITITRVVTLDIHLARDLLSWFAAQGQAASLRATHTLPERSTEEIVRAHTLLHDYITRTRL